MLLTAKHCTAAVLTLHSYHCTCVLYVRIYPYYVHTLYFFTYDKVNGLQTNVTSENNNIILNLLNIILYMVWIIISYKFTI